MDKLIFSDSSSNDIISSIISTTVFIILVLVIKHVNKRRQLNAGLNSENNAVNGLVNLGMFFLMFILVGLSFYVSSSVLKNTNTIILTEGGIQKQGLFASKNYTWSDVNSFVIKIVPQTSLHSSSKKRYYQNSADIVTKNNSAPLCFGLTSELSISLSNGDMLNIKNDEIYQTKRGVFSVTSSPVMANIAQLKTISKGRVPVYVAPFDTSDIEYMSCIQQGFELNTVYKDLIQH